MGSLINLKAVHTEFYVDPVSVLPARVSGCNFEVEEEGVKVVEFIDLATDFFCRPSHSAACRVLTVA